MAIGKLLATPGNTRAFKALIVAKYNGVELDSNLTLQMGVDNKTPEYLAKFPTGKVPVFEKPGLNLTDSTAIAYYIASQKADSPLLGKTAEETAQILQYLFFAEAEISPAIALALYPRLGFNTYFKPSVQQGDELLKRFLGTLNNILLDKTFLVGERLTVADINMVCDLFPLYKFLLDKKYRKEIRNVTRYFKTLVNQPIIKEVVGEFVYCETPVEYVPPKKEKAPKKEAAKPAAAEKPKPAAAPAATAAEAAAPAPKPKSKLDLLPKSQFNLEDWKRFYSNNDTVPTAMDYFWKNFDPEGYAIWKVDYKYPEDLTLTFMSNNLIGGFYNRLGRATKYAFGSMLVLGTNNDNIISGYFVIRGQEIPEEVTDAADFDSYQFTKVDHNDPKVRQEIQDYFAWDGPTLPRPCADGKVFK